jgi:hypothetical protein
MVPGDPRPSCSKLAAGRDQDLRFVQVLLSERLVSVDVLLERIRALPLPVDQIPAVHARASRIVAK